MMNVAIFSVIVGMTLGQRFKVLILVPAIAIALLIAVGAGIAHADGPGMIILSSVLSLVGLQIGYLAGTGIRILMAAARAGRLRASPVEGPLHVRRTAH
jgi:hypothetical protein